MGTAAAENVAVRINTSADTSGVTAARTELGSLGAEAEKVAADTSKLTVSAAQMSAALQKTGGDIQKAGQLLAAEAQAAQRATVATETLRTHSRRPPNKKRSRPTNRLSPTRRRFGRWACSRPRR
jgi:hypothetical protein